MIVGVPKASVGVGAVDDNNALAEFGTAYSGRAQVARASLGRQSGGLQFAGPIIRVLMAENESDACCSVSISRASILLRRIWARQRSWLGG